MVHRLTTASCAAVLLLATTAWGQAGDYTGTVTHIDRSTNTVYFSDGRILHLEPGATLTLDGRQIRLDDVKPGTSMRVDRRHPGLVSRPQAGAGQMPQPQPGTGQARQQGTAMVLTGHPPVDVTGTVARVDAQSGLITFQDGRTVQVTNQARVWTAKTGQLQPGERVLVRNAVPVAFQGATGTPMPQGMTHRMGTVAAVDEGQSRIVLTDGTTVRIQPSSRIHHDGQRITIGDLDPGDEVLLIVRQPALSQGGLPQQGDPASALPRQQFSRATIDAQDVQVLFRHQAGG